MGKKIAKEGERISRETGIDFSKYWNPEMGLGEKIGELIDITGKVASTILVYLILPLVVLVAISYKLSSGNMNIAGVILIFAVGVLMILLGGTARGFMKLVNDTVSNSSELIVLLLDFVKEVRRGVKSLQKKEPDQPGKKVSVSQFVEGISYVVFIPAVSDVLRSRLSLLSRPLIWVNERVLLHFTKAIAAILPASEVSGDQEQDADAEEKEIDGAAEKISGFSSSVTRTVNFPAKILFVVSVMIGVPAILIIFWIF